MVHMIKLCFLLLACLMIGCRPNPLEGTLTEVHIDELLSSEIITDLNPSGLTPLSARLQFSTTDEAIVTTSVLGDYEAVKTSESFTKDHTLEIHGLYPNTNNTIKLEVITEDSIYRAFDTIYIQTDSLPFTFPDIEIIEMESDLMEPGWNLIELSIGGLDQLRFNPIIFDPSGIIRWYMNLDFIQSWIGPFERLRNGNWIWANQYMIYEYNMMGREVNQWVINGYNQHHDIIEKPDGNLIIPVSKWDEDSILDHIIELDRNSNQIVREWDLRKVMDVNRFDFTWNSRDWAHVNSIWYDETNEGLVISARHQGIIKVDMDNTLEWIIAPHQGWELAGILEEGVDTRDFLLDAINTNHEPYSDEIQQGKVNDSDFSWPWGQHAAMVLENGHIFCFDNGSRQNFGDNAGYIRGVEYAVDTDQMTVQEVWQYGEERGEEIHSDNISDVDVLIETGNRLIAPGNINSQGQRASRLIEVDYPSGTVVYEAIVHFKDALSNGQGWGQSDISYRAERLALYP